MREYDCIVVGARCAGAALATHLARDGMRVLVLEADALHSDQPFSTHAIQALGMDLLDELGVGARIRQLTPTVRCARLEMRGHVLDVPLPPDRPFYCPRRATLDPLLQDAAQAAGAELRTQTRVTELVFEGERVCGVRAVHAGHSEVLRSRCVVGADGRNSTVARGVGARSYIEHETERAGYWSYFPIPDCWHTDEPWRRFQTLISLDRFARFAFECDGELLIMGAFGPYSEVRAWGAGQAAAALRQTLLSSPLMAPLAQAEPVAPVIGLLKARFFMREPVGPGWALIGDAGIHKDPTPGYGITDALTDARALADALRDGSREALELFWRERDVAAIPFYFQALGLGRLSFINAFSECYLDHVNADPQLIQRTIECLERVRSPFESVPTTRMLKWVAGAALRGRIDIARSFLVMAALSLEMQRALAPRERLLRRHPRKQTLSSRVSRSLACDARM